MKRRYLQIGLALAIVALMSIACLPLVGGAGTGSASLLTPQEKAFAKAVGTGEYEYGIDYTYSYDYGELEFPVGSGLTAWRPVGSTAQDVYAGYLVKEMKSIGLKDVKKEAFPATGFDYGGASVQIVSPYQGDVWLAASHAGLPGTGPNGITADIVYVGLGTMYDYQGKDVNGKLVLIDVSEEEMFWLQYPLMEAEVHGALGAVVTWVEYQLLPNSVVTHDSESRSTIPCLDISKENAAVLKDMIADGITPKVKIWADVDLNFQDTGYNVVGYIPSANYGTPADRFVIAADHYDKWWYGSDDNGAGVGRLLGMAKALVDSHYTPSRTIIFLATSAEEFGWADTEFDWALGAWWEIFVIHPEWVGKSLGMFQLEGGGTIGATSVSAFGTPETLEWRKSLLPKFNEWFSKTAPWSKYYVRASVETDSFATTWADGFSFCAAGVPMMSVSSTRSDYAGYDYHTQKDAMYGISAESLAMSTIANGLAIIELDKAKFAPYSFQDRAANLKAALDTKLIGAAGVDAQPVLDALAKFSAAGGDVWSLMAKSSASAVKVAKANDLLLKAAYRVLFDMTTVGEYTESMYSHITYMDDALYFREGISALQTGNIEGALMWLSNPNGMYTGRMVSPEVYQYLVIDRWDNPDRTDLFWATGRLAFVEDFYSEYQSLVEKKAAGITDYSDEIAALTLHYQSVVGHLQESLDSMVATLDTATVLLLDAESLMALRR